MPQFKRVRPNPRSIIPAPRTSRNYPQCQMPVNQMSPGALGWTKTSGENWRFDHRATTHRHSHKDPNFCFLDAQIDIDGRMFCTKHAGAIALEIMLGERKGAPPDKVSIPHNKVPSNNGKPVHDLDPEGCDCPVCYQAYQYLNM